MTGELVTAKPILPGYAAPVSEDGERPTGLCDTTVLSFVL